MLLGFLLFYVGAVLFLNGIWLMGKIQDREIVVINIVSGLVAAGVEGNHMKAPVGQNLSGVLPGETVLAAAVQHQDRGPVFS